MMEFGLIGWPLGHSKSPEYWTSKFKNLGVDAEYHAFPIDSIDRLPELIASHPDLRGFNITIPYKQEVMKYLDHIDEAAKRIGAVNTVRISRDGDKVSMSGYNTDYLGFMNSIRPLVNLLDPLISVSHPQALVLGSGGASKAVSYALEVMGIPHKVVTRTPCGPQYLAYSQLDKEILDAHHIIINTTSLGMWPNVKTTPDIPWELVSGSHLCYDVVYNPAVTEFMKRAADRGCAVKNGLEMLHGQADAAWNIWTSD